MRRSREWKAVIIERSYEKITISDLKKLQALALKERENFFDRNPRLKEPYWDSLVAIALCQGAALHFFGHQTGVKDFDIWYFYVENAQVKYPYRTRKQVDSKLAKFGIHPEDVDRGYVGRRADLMGRAINVDIVHGDKRDPKSFISKYLKLRRTKTAKELAEKAVIGLWPETILGERIWQH